MKNLLFIDAGILAIAAVAAFLMEDLTLITEIVVYVSFLFFCYGGDFNRFFFYRVQDKGKLSC